MLSAVDLDDEAMIGCEEIHDIIPERNLSPEFHAVDLAVAQPVPEPAFGIGRPLAQLAGAL